MLQGLEGDDGHGTYAACQQLSRQIPFLCMFVATVRPRRPQSRRLPRSRRSSPKPASSPSSSSSSTHSDPLSPSQMTVAQLSSLIQRMEDAKAKLEVSPMTLFSVDTIAASARHLLPQAFRRDPQQPSPARAAAPRGPCLRNGPRLHADRVQSVPAGSFLLHTGATDRRWVVFPSFPQPSSIRRRERSTTVS